MYVCSQASVPADAGRFSSAFPRGVLGISAWFGSVARRHRRRTPGRRHWRAARRPAECRRHRSSRFLTSTRIARERAAQPYADSGPRASRNSIAKAGEKEERGEEGEEATTSTATSATARRTPSGAASRCSKCSCFIRGFNFDRRVNLFEVSDAGVRPILYSPSMFDFGKNPSFGQLPPETGFAGFRVHYPLHTPAYKDEVVAFLGASYFRALGRNQGYGASARGLAIDTATERARSFRRSRTSGSCARSRAIARS